MTPEELQNALLANEKSYNTANSFLIFNKHLKIDAEERYKSTEDELEVASADLLEKTETLNELAGITAASALAIDPNWKPPLFDAYSLTEVPKDNNFYIPLKTEIDNQLIAYNNMIESSNVESELRERLLHEINDYNTIVEQIEKTKALIDDLTVTRKALESEQQDQDLIEAERIKTEAEIAELKRLDELRQMAKYEINYTKKKFFFNFDIESDSRFDMEKFIEKDSDFFDIYNSNFLSVINTIKQTGEFKVTNEEMRIDLISYRIYGTTQFWWMLLEYNNIIDQFSIKQGDILKFFDLSDLESKYHHMQRQQHQKGE